MNLQEMKFQIYELNEQLSKCESADEAESIINQLDEYSDELINMLHTQYQNIKDVALGDHEQFKNEIQKLFEINSLIELI